MSSNRRPWYPWYPRDFMQDEKVRMLSDDAELIYRRALDVMWQASAIHLPSNCYKLAKALARGWSQDRFDDAWEEIQTEGYELLKTSDDGKWVYSERLKREADKIATICENRKSAGKRGGKAKSKQVLSKCQASAKQNPTHTDTDIKENNKRKVSRKTTIPESFPLTDSLRQYATARGYSGNVEDFHERFVLQCEAKAYKYADFSKAWMSWLRKEMESQPKQETHGPTGKEF